MTFAGPGQAAAAERAAADLRRLSPVLRGVFVEARGDRSAVLLGRFAFPPSAEIVETMAAVREIEVDGRRPFATAFFVPPVEGPVGEYDLRTARERFDADCTLQVGVYGRIDGRSPSSDEIAQFRASAEQAVRDLRSQGEQAFVFHGPTLSMVTVGAMRFDDIEADPSVLRSLQDRFPHNLLNGRGIREKVQTEQGEDWRLQPSTLVGIPE
ncbi:MAG: hypothetical protein AAFR96_11690 [Planctomycetota bacterium]